MTEKRDLGHGRGLSPIDPPQRRHVTFEDVVGPERARQYAEEKRESDRRIAKRRRELGSSAWGLAELYGFRTIAPALDETAK